MRTHRSQEGYLFIDNGPGGGPTLADLAAAGGLDVAGAGARGVFESATVTCKHCQTVVVLNPKRDRARGYCRKCDGYVCDKPECNLTCLPMNKVLDVALEIAHRNPDQVQRAIDDLRRDVLGVA